MEVVRRGWDYSLRRQTPVRSTLAGSIGPDGPDRDPGFGVGCGAAQWAPNRRSKGRPAINRYPTPSIFYN